MPEPHTARPDPILRPGQFFGSVGRWRQAGAFTVAHWEADPNRTVGIHTHEDAHFILPLRGAYRSTASGAPEVCDRSIVIYNPPGTTHADRFEPVAGPVEGRFFTVSMPVDRIQLARSVGRPPTHPIALRHQAVHTTVCRLAAECAHWSATSGLVAEGLCLELLGAIARCRPEPGRQPPSWLVRARTLLEESTPSSIESVAGQVGVHPIHLARMFRKYFNTSPGEFRRRARLAKAELLLRNHRVPIAAIATSCGFADQSHFTKAFTQHHGVAPGRYRKTLA